MRQWHLPREIGGQPTLGVVILLAFAATLPLACTTPPRALALRAAPDVSVVLARNVPQWELQVDGPYEVLADDGRRLGSGTALAPGRFARDAAGQVQLNGVSFPFASVTLRPRGSPIRVGNRQYLGDLQVQAQGERLDVRNVLDLESYVAGVLFSEMPSSFPREALRAQAVASRTYAYHRLLQGGSLASTDADQVYDGLSSRAAFASEIVASTRGEVLEEDGEVLKAYFSSTCGGATGSAEEVFLEPRRRALSGTRCDWCRESPRYRWSRSIPTARLAQRLGIPGPTIDTIRRRTDSFGRTLEFRVVAPDFSRDFSGLQFRVLWNSGASGVDEQLLSPFILDLRLNDAELQVDGAGWGHGVGMCQYGTSGLARSGRDYREILAFYYAGAQLNRRW